MAVFAVLSEKTQPALRATIEQAFPGKFYHWSEQASFIVANGSAKALAEALNIISRNADGTTSGTIGGVFVSQLSASYWGWTGKALWDWLADAHQQSGA